MWLERGEPIISHNNIRVSVPRHTRCYTTVTVTQDRVKDSELKAHMLLCVDS